MSEPACAAFQYATTLQSCELHSQVALAVGAYDQQEVGIKLIGGKYQAVIGGPVRAGPGPEYREQAMFLQRKSVQVKGCTIGWQWCRIFYDRNMEAWVLNGRQIQRVVPRRPDLKEES